MNRLPCLLPLLLLASAFTSRAAELAIPDNVTFERDITYAEAGGARMQLNLARPKNASGPLPTVLCIHGGGFRAGSREGYNKLCLSLAQRGFVAATISYRLAPMHQFPAAVHDTKAAVRWLRANAAKYGINPDRIGVTGGSAGDFADTTRISAPFTMRMSSSTLSAADFLDPTVPLKRPWVESYLSR